MRRTPPRAGAYHGDRARERRRGFTLLAALVALALVGALAAGAALSAARDAREGDESLREPRALDAAESALARRAWLRWRRADNVTVPVGGVLGPDTIPGVAGSRAIVRVTRLDAATFWLAAEGEAALRRSLDARRRVGLLARLALPTVAIDGALATGGTVTLSGTAHVSGIDTLPGGWGAVCPPAAGMLAGIVASDATRVCDGGCGAPPTRVVGAPPVLPDPTASDSARYSAFGDESWASLVARADVTLPAGAYRPRPAVVAGRCDASDPLDWGDPSRGGPCADHFPLVHVAGDLTALPGGAGQGILLVDGDLVLGGGFRFVGLAIVRGAVRASGNGNQLLGALLVDDRARGVGSVIGGDTRVARSRCAIERGMAGASPLVAARERAWTQLFER